MNRACKGQVKRSRSIQESKVLVPGNEVFYEKVT